MSADLLSAEMHLEMLTEGQQAEDRKISNDMSSLKVVLGRINVPCVYIQAVLGDPGNSLVHLWQYHNTTEVWWTQSETKGWKG